MDDPERGVTITHAFDEDAKRDDVVDLVDRAVVRLHLAPDRVEVFGTPSDVGGKALLGEAARERLRHLEDVLVPLLLRLLNAIPYLGVPLRFEPPEGEVFELALEGLNAEAICERRVNLERLACDPLLSLGLHVL